MEFAGRADMPQRSICFQPTATPLYMNTISRSDRKTFIDARLEVVGPKLYEEYIALDRKIAHNDSGWEAQLEAMKRPLVVVDNVYPAKAGTVATMLTAQNYKCIWFDPIVGMYVHTPYAGVAERARD